MKFKVTIRRFNPATGKSQGRYTVVVNAATEPQAYDLALPMRENCHDQVLSAVAVVD